MVQVQKMATLSGHAQAVYALIAGAQPQQVISASGDGQIVSWNLDQPETGRLMARLNNSCYALAFDPATRILAIAENTEGLHFIDIDNLKEAGSVGIKSAGIFCLAAGHGRFFAGDSQGRLTIIDAASLQVIAQVQLADKSLRSLSISPTEPLIAAAFSDNTVRILTIDGQVIYELNEHRLSVFSVQFHPHLPLLATAGRDAHLKLFDAGNDYQLLADVPAHLYAINSLSFSPGGQWLATGSMDKTVKIWQAENLKLVKVIDRARHGGHASSVNAVLWTNHGHQIVSGGDDRSINLWQLNLQHELV